jgi:hypothetical protein
MRRLWIVPVACVALLLPVSMLATSGDTCFDAVVHSVESRYHARATRVPFMGLVSAITRGATKNGVGGMRVADIDDISEPVDGAELNRLVAEKLGPGWERMIRDSSHNELSLIFVHPNGPRAGVFIVALDGREVSLVEFSVDPSHLQESLDQHTRHHHENADNGNESE